ncbi:hypothetical protein AKG39_09640 [Acetobacterium bakii]|uniref:Uncharacterized protein n=1 Tax=Acetobacterium bakii TaxID=52689 RepID=A0A0L6U047_9FIRM|nr:hypothetical protein AKG39_09640 [Acetobacterium bakii]
MTSVNVKQTHKSIKSLFAILILGVCSPMRSTNMNFQMILDNLSFAMITWLMLIKQRRVEA